MPAESIYKINKIRADWKRKKKKKSVSFVSSKTEYERLTCCWLWGFLFWFFFLLSVRPECVTILLLHVYNTSYVRLVTVARALSNAILFQVRRCAGETGWTPPRRITRVFRTGYDCRLRVVVIIIIILIYFVGGARTWAFRKFRR